MDKPPSIDRELLIPIMVGGFSVFGIIIIFMVGRLNASRAAIPVEQTETPFKYIFLGTEPGVLTGSPQASNTELLTGIPFDSPTPRPPEATQALGTPAIETPTLEMPVLVTPNDTALPTSTSASGPPLNPGTYDDVDSHIVYDGPGWTSQSGVAGAHQGTLHVSQVPGSSVTFSFIGRELRIFYQGAASLGQMIITIDGQSFTLNQATGNEWISSSFADGTHNVSITHASGGSVNLDYIIIPEVPSTATPTATPTRTPSP